jgi:starch-binding outer membrane protein, SusD/RagB family
MTDEFKSGDTFEQRNNADQRVTQSSDGVAGATYTPVQQSRGRARDAINSLKEFAPTETAKIAEMYFVMGFMELTLGQNWCNGIPLGETVNGVPQYTEPLTNAQVFTTAIARFDSALAILGTSSTTEANNVRNAVLIAKGRAQVDLGQFAAAATTVAPVPTSYTYNITYSQTTQSNGWWWMTTNTKRYTVGDSVDAVGTIKNAIPFVSLADPRVKVAPVNGRSFDTATPWYEFLNYARESAIPLVNGTDARLIEAEAKLQANDFAGMMTILNALRTSPPAIGPFTPTAMTALATPANRIAAENLYFREKALWQFARGERLSDLRRLVRQYGRTQDNVFPSGPFHKNGNYGTNVNFPVPDAPENPNPNFKGCIDRNA